MYETIASGYQYERIIPQALYEKANAMMKRRNPKNAPGIKPGVDRHIHLLKGLIKCQSCGSTMTPMPSGKRDKDGNQYRYYVCTDVIHNKEVSSCEVKSFSARPFENTVIQFLRDLGKNPAIVHKCVQFANQGLPAGAKKLENEEKHLNKAMQSISDEIKALIPIVKKGQKSTAEFVKEIDRLNAEREKLQNELEKVQVEISIKNVRQIDLDSVERNLTQFTQLVDKLPMQEKKELLRLVIKEIRVSRVNPKTAKAPAEQGAFDCKIRTKWFRVVISLFALPAIPAGYDEGGGKFVFDSNWLPGQDSNLRRGD